MTRIDPLNALRNIVIKHAGCDHRTEDDLYREIARLCQDVDKQRANANYYLHHSIVNEQGVPNDPRS